MQFVARFTAPASRTLHTMPCILQISIQPCHRQQASWKTGVVELDAILSDRITTSDVELPQAVDWKGGRRPHGDRN